MKAKERKKGLLATIWESMTKTGGCCGGGEDCCGPASKGGEKSAEQERNKGPEK